MKASNVYIGKAKGSNLNWIYKRRRLINEMWSIDSELVTVYVNKEGTICSTLPYDGYELKTISNIPSITKEYIKYMQGIQERSLFNYDKGK
jgi:hypothetical protein